MGGNVAVVWKITPSQWEQSRPQDWNGYPVLNGDETDLRFLDPPGSVIGLYAKGKGRKDKTGFVVSLPVIIQ